MTPGRSVSGRVALVTGAGRGIGRATATALAHAGARVAVCDIDLDVAQDVAGALQAPGAIARAYRLDVRRREDHDSVVERIERDLGTVSILVNNAGLMCIGGFLDQDPAVDAKQLDVNLRGVIHGMRAVLPGMVTRGDGHVVNVASLAARIPAPSAAVYTATKFGVLGLTEAVRFELRDSGVAFTTVVPAFVRTDLIAGTRPPPFPPPVSPEAVARAIVRAIERGEEEVYVPKIGRALGLLPSLLPRRVLEWLGEALGGAEMFSRVDTAARAAYVERTRRDGR